MSMLPSQSLSEALANPERLTALRRVDLLDTPAEEAFDRLTRLATKLLDVPVALVNFVDEERQFLKSALGLSPPIAAIRQHPAAWGFCPFAIALRTPLAVCDAMAEPEWADNTVVRTFGVRAYLGVPLIYGDQPIGTFCVVDFRPRCWSDDDVASLQDLAASVMSEIRLRVEARLVETLHTTGLALAAKLDLEDVVQAATDAVTTASGAQFGAFFCNVVNFDGETRLLYTVSGMPREAFENLPRPRTTTLFAPTVQSAKVVRLADVTADPRYGHNPPHHGTPHGHPAVRSYMAVPVVSGTGEVLGAFFLGHRRRGMFDERAEWLALGIAAQTATAIDNARLYERQRATAIELQQSLLPQLPTLSGLDLAARYLPAAGGSDVGGDWFDVIPLACGRRGLRRRAAVPGLRPG
jgi:GAF domain-containing protein